MNPDVVKKLLGTTGEDPTLELFDRYNDELYRVDFSDSSEEERLRASQTRFDEITEEVPGLYVANPGKAYFASYVDVVRSIVIPGFVKKSQGKVLRPEGLANILFATVHELKDNPDKRVSINSKNIKDVIYDDPDALGALINSLLPEDSPANARMRKAFYAVIQYDPDWSPGLEKLEENARFT